MRKRALRDEISELRAEREKGKIEGKLEGLEEALARLIANGTNEAQARKLLGL
ncbi:hypothetical protein [Thiorhodococcus mannitoliphagus]|uniref:hypothetical protein n=1 Tax=Thiorhodococcus mannitoliphagus TaxID=329406 RepID=UPI0030B88EF0